MNVFQWYRAMLFAMAGWGIIALMLTGEFNFGLLALTLALMVAAWFVRSRGLMGSVALWNVLTLGAFVVAAGIANRSLMDATVYFFCFLQLPKLFTLRRNADVRWIYLIAFFHIIATSVLTTSLSFAFTFIVFLALMGLNLILHTIASEASNSVNEARRIQAKLLGERAPGALDLGAAISRTSGGERIERSALWRWALGAAAMTFAISAVLFGSIPRLGSQNLIQSYGKPLPKPSVSAFDENIEFGAIEQIQLSNAVAMYVRPTDADVAPPPYLRLRGVALDTFDGRSWRRTTQFPGYGGSQPFESLNLQRTGTLRNYTIIQPPGVTNYLFADYRPVSLKLNLEQQAIYFDPYSNSAWMPTTLQKEFTYNVTSLSEGDIQRVSPAELARQNALTTLSRAGVGESGGRAAPHLRAMLNIADKVIAKPNASAEQLFGNDIFRHRAGQLDAEDDLAMRRMQNSARYLRACLRLPEILNSERLATLAREMTQQGSPRGASVPPGGAAAAAKPDAYQQALSIETVLRNKYGYTLQPRSRGNFIEDFLFNTKEGHCEYFATGMTVLCRSLGIPARVVNGFYCVEWNAIGNAFTVRQRDAHSWVEVYLQGYGWMAFDPTPPSGVGRQDNRNALLLEWERLVDALRVRWYRYIIDYSSADQQSVLSGLSILGDRIQRALNAVGNWNGASLPTLGSSEWTGTYGWAVVGGAGGVGALIAALRWIAWRRRNPRTARQRMVRVVKFYAEALRVLRRRGLRRRPAQTPAEFAREVAAQPSLSGFGSITELYYQVRYGEHEPSAEELRTVQEKLDTLRQAKARA